jgi:two-component system OmpR family response regulator
VPERILIVDDEPDLLELVRFNLSQAGFEVETAQGGLEGLEKAHRRRPDLLVLDLMLPDLPGTEVCRRLRNDPELAGLPILMLTARSEEIDRVVGLELGADDYVTKPFSPRELVARVKARLRTHAAPPLADVTERFVVRHGPLTMDAERHRCAWGESEIELSATEFLLLHALIGSPERVYTRADIVARAYGHGHHITERTVDSHVRRIRAKFDPLGIDPIETVYGVGYRMRRPEA